MAALLGLAVVYYGLFFYCVLRSSQSWWGWRLCLCLVCVMCAARRRPPHTAAAASQGLYWPLQMYQKQNGAQLSLACLADGVSFGHLLPPTEVSPLAIAVHHGREERLAKGLQSWASPTAELGIPEGKTPEGETPEGEGG